MSDFPHVYTTTAEGSNEVILELTSENLPPLSVTPPKEFGGPEGYWNPEALFSAAISTCFILTFKAISRGKKLVWDSITVDVDAYLDQTNNKLSFTRADIFVTLKIPASAAGTEDAYLRSLQRAEETCLITNSIKASLQLHPKIELSHNDTSSNNKGNV